MFLDRLLCKKPFARAEAISRSINREILKLEMIINNIFDHLLPFLKSVAVTQFSKYKI